MTVNNVQSRLKVLSYKYASIIYADMTRFSDRTVHSLFYFQGSSKINY